MTNLINIINPQPQVVIDQDPDTNRLTMFLRN